MDDKMNNSLKTDEIFRKHVMMFMCVEQITYKIKNGRQASWIQCIVQKLWETAKKYDDIKREYLQFLLPFLRTRKRIRNIPVDFSFVRKHDIHYNNQYQERKQVRVLKKKIWYIAVFETTKQKTNRQNFSFNLHIFYKNLYSFNLF